MTATLPKVEPAANRAGAPRWLIVAAPVLIVLSVLAAYNNSLHGCFVLDDGRNIDANSTVRSLLPSHATLLGPPWTSLTGRPLPQFTMALDYRMYGLNVEGYHVFNIIVHTLVALALLGVLWRTFQLPRLQGYFAGHELAVATLIALIWAVHPLNSACVTYISQRIESLMALFYLLTIYCFIRAATGGSAIWFFLSVIACFLGLASKEPMVSAPLMVFLFDRMLIANSFDESLKTRRWYYFGLLLTWIPFFALTSMNPHGTEVGLTHPDLSGLDYLKTQPHAILTYLKLCFWPHPLILYYGHANFDVPIHRQFAEFAPRGAVILVLLGLTAWGLFRRKPLALLGALFFMVLGPSSSFISMPSEVISEYRMYLPSAAVIGVVVIGGYLLLRQMNRWARINPVLEAIALVLSSGVVLICIFVTRNRNDDFRSSLIFWQDAVAQTGGKSGTALGNLGLFEVKAGRYGEALVHLQRSIQLRPRNDEVHTAIGTIAKMNFDYTTAINEFLLAHQQRPESVTPLTLLSQTLIAMGRLDDAINAVEQADANSTPLKVIRIRLLLAALYEKAGQTERGRQLAEESLGMEGNLAYANTAAGETYNTFELPIPAIDHFRRAVEAGSRDPATYMMLGVALASVGDMRGAIDNYRKCLNLQPDDFAAMNNLAWMLATIDDPTLRSPAEAVELAERAALVTQNQYSTILDTLATAYAGVGRFDDAVRVDQKALEQIGPNSATEDAKGIRLRLEMFRKGQPFIDPARRRIPH